MPIHVPWKSMIKSFLNNKKYCKKNSKRKCRKLSDGSRICGCQGGWSIFFATVNKMDADDTKPMPKKKKKNFNESKITSWFIGESKKYPILPKWVSLAQKILTSPQFEESVKVYWKDKLRGFCELHPEASICKEVDLSE